jgi:hypothetical protein
LKGPILLSFTRPRKKKTHKIHKGKSERREGQLHLIQADLRSAHEFKNVVEKAKETMGQVNILVLNHRYQMIKEAIGEPSEYVLRSTSPSPEARDD